jgi:hypothetical protein
MEEKSIDSPEYDNGHVTNAGIRQGRSPRLSVGKFDACVVIPPPMVLMLSLSGMGNAPVCFAFVLGQLSAPLPERHHDPGR